MIRLSVIAIGLVFAAAEPVASSGEADLLKYAVTQGGLLAVVLVLLYWVKYSSDRKIEEEQASTRYEQEQKIEANRRADRLMDLIGESNSSLTHHTAALNALAHSIQRLEDIDRRTGLDRRGDR